MHARPAFAASEANPLTTSKRCSPRCTLSASLGLAYWPFVCQQVTTQERRWHTGQSSAQLGFVFCGSLHGNFANSHSSGTASSFRAANRQMSMRALASCTPPSCISDWTSLSAAAQRLHGVACAQRHAVLLHCITPSHDDSRGWLSHSVTSAF